MNYNKIAKKLDKWNPLAILLTIIGFPLTLLSLFDIRFKASVNVFHIILLVLFLLLFVYYYAKKKKYLKGIMDMLKIYQFTLKIQKEKNLSSPNEYLYNLNFICSKMSTLLRQLTGRNIIVSLGIFVDDNGTLNIKYIIHSALNENEQGSIRKFAPQMSLNDIGELFNLKEENVLQIVRINIPRTDKYNNVTNYSGTMVVPLMMDNVCFGIINFDNINKKDQNKLFYRIIVQQFAMIVTPIVYNIHKSECDNIPSDKQEFSRRKKNTVKKKKGRRE